MTNGEKIREIFPNVDTEELDYEVFTTLDGSTLFTYDWWNAEYKEPSSSEKPNKSEKPTGSATKKVINIAKEFAEEMMKKFTFEEVARLFYSNSCSFCPKQHKCMGVDSVKECVNAIREKYEVDYGKEVEEE